MIKVIMRAESEFNVEICEECGGIKHERHVERGDCVKGYSGPTMLPPIETNESNEERLRKLVGPPIDKYKEI